MRLHDPAAFCRSLQVHFFQFADLEIQMRTRKATKGTTQDSSGVSSKKPEIAPKTSKRTTKKAASSKITESSTDSADEEATQTAWRHVATPLPSRRPGSRPPARKSARSRSSLDDVPQEGSGSRSGTSNVTKTFMTIGVVFTLLCFLLIYVGENAAPGGTVKERSKVTLVPMLSSISNTTFIINIKSAWNATTHTPRAFARRLYGLTKGKISGYIESADKGKTKSKTTLSSANKKKVASSSKLKKASSGGSSSQSKKVDNDKNKSKATKNKKEAVQPVKPVTKKGGKGSLEKQSWRSMLASSLSVTLPKSLSPTFNLSVPTFNLTLQSMASLSQNSQSTSSKTPTGRPTAARKREEDTIFKKKVAETKAIEAARLKAAKLAEDKRRLQKEQASKEAKVAEAQKRAKEEAMRNIPAIDHSHHNNYDVGGIWRGGKVLTSQRVVGNIMLSSSWYHHYDSPLSNVIGLIRHIRPPINHLYDSTGHSTRIPKDYFSFVGHTGTCSILFRHMVRIKQFALYHPSVDSEYAPKDFRVLGWPHNPIEWKYRAMQPVVIGYFTFHTKKSKNSVQKDRQVFDVMRHKVQLPFRAVTLQVLSNHQTLDDISASTSTSSDFNNQVHAAKNSTEARRAPRMTKIYRFQVLGEEAMDVSL